MSEQPCPKSEQSVEPTHELGVNVPFNQVGEPMLILHVLTLCLAFLLFCNSMTAAFWVPIAWMCNIAPVMEAQTEHMQNQARALYWLQSEDRLRRFLDPSRFAEHLSNDFAAEYGELYRKYQRQIRNQYEAFEEKNFDLGYAFHKVTYKVVQYQGMRLQYPEDHYFVSRFKKTPYQTRFFCVLWGLTLSSILAGYSLFRLRRSEKKTMLLTASLIALMSSGLLIVLPVIYCWQVTATGSRNFYGDPNFVGELSDFWGIFILLGLAGYVCSVILFFTIFFVPKNKTVFHNLRARLALILVLLPGLLGSAGGYLICSVSVDLREWHIYAMLQCEEMPKLEAIYLQFNEDYQRLVERHGIKLPAVPRPDESFRIPEEQPIATYWRLACTLNHQHGLISCGDLNYWSPPQKYMTHPETVAGFFVFAMIVLFGVPGLVFAVLHIVRLKQVLPRNGLIFACIAIFFYPVLFTPLFFLAWNEMKHTNSYDYFIFLFFAIIGTIGISAGIYAIRRHLRP